MVQQHIVATKFFEQILRLPGKPQLTRNKSLELQLWVLHLLVNIEKS